MGRTKKASGKVRGRDGISAPSSSSSNDKNKRSKTAPATAATATATGSTLSRGDNAGGDFLARLLSALPTHLIPHSSNSTSTALLSDKHPVCRLLSMKESTSGTSKQSGSSSHNHHAPQQQQHEEQHAVAASTLPNSNISETSSSDTAATYWLVLATHCLQQLLPLPQPSEQQQQQRHHAETTTTTTTAEVAAWLCYGIAQVLPRNKLDSSLVTKQLVGRALLVVSLGASQALSILSSSQNHNNNSNNNATASTIACIVALDRVTLAVQPHAASAGVAPPDAYWASLQWDELQPSNEFLESLQQEQLDSSALLLQDWSAADACWRALTSLSSSKDNSSSNVLETFQGLLRNQNSTFSEGRLALKRWSSVALTWYNGQEHMLRAALELLQNDNWGSVVVCKAVVPNAADDNHDQQSNNNHSSKSEGKSVSSSCASQSTSFSRKEKKTATSCTTSSSTTVVVVVPPNVAKLALVGRLCRIVHETGAAAGSRPPTGELDVFLKTLMAASLGTTTTMTVAKKGQKVRLRSDIRDLVMVVVYHWIRQHQACLRKNFGNADSTSISDGLTTAMVINDDEADAIRQGQGNNNNNKSAIIRCWTSSSLESLYYYYPFVHEALEEMASAASSNLTGHGLFQCRDRIQFAAAAFVIQAQRQAARTCCCPLDAKLTRFAVSKLVSCLSSSSNNNINNPMADSVLSMVTAASPSTESVNDSRGAARRPAPDANVAKTSFARRLPVPSLLPLTGTKATAATTTRKRKVITSAATATKLPHCSFAGVYEQPKATANTNNNDSGEFTADDKLQLFVQSVQDDDDGDDDEYEQDHGKPSVASAPLASHLLWILETCFDTRESLAVDAAPLEGKKRKATTIMTTTTTTLRSSKRQKRVVGRGRKKNSDSDDLGGLVVPERWYQPLKGLRGTVAAETMDALCLFLRDPLVNTSLTTMQATLRQSVTVEQMGQLLELGPVLYQVIVKSRLRALESLIHEMDGSKSASIVLEEAGRYSDQEHSLWMKHKDLLIMLGRGREEFVEQMRIAPILGDLRLPLYKRISELSNRRSPKGWPLCLNPFHRIFLASSLTAEPVVPVSDIVGREADIFIVDGFVTELECALKELGMLEMTMTIGSLSVSEDIAVTWNDARIFLAAFARLTPEEQSSTFSSLLIPVTRVFAELTATADKKKNEVLSSCGVSSFLARLVTLCVNTYVIMIFGSGAREELFRALGKYISDHVPGISASEEWFTADNAFLGVFTNWADAELPAIPLPCSFIKIHEGVDMLQGLLESAFAVGFVTAKYDQCHLLFATWNALGKNDLWITSLPRIQMVTTLPSSLSTLLLQLREDVAFVHRLALRATSSFNPTSTLLKAIDQRDTVMKGYSLQSLKLELKVQLRMMIQKASKIVDLLLQQFIPSDAMMQQDVPPEVFCLLEACATYISFAISTYTRPKYDLFSSIMLAMTERAMQNRDRGYSTDSADNHSDGGSEESNDVLIDTMERMQDVCTCIGAAPAHPDWLDKDCRLLEGLSTEEASEAALEAQACLTKLLSVGLIRSRLSHWLALQNCLGAGKESVARLASNLWWLQHFSSGESGVSMYMSGKRKYITDVGEICGLDAETSGIVMADSVVGSRHAATASWQGHTAQRILGRYQEPFRNGLAGEVETAELRASGEWEVLLSGALTSASICVKLPAEGAVVDEGVCCALKCSGCWSGVCRSAIDALVPTVALLRFCLCSGLKNAHPLSSVDASISSFNSNTAVIADDIPNGPSASRSTVDAVFLTIGTLALYPSLATCDAVAKHLLVDSSHLDCLRGMEVSSLALQMLTDLLDVFETNAPDCCEACPFVIERIADVLKECATVQRDDGRRIPYAILGSLRHESALPFIRLKSFVTQDDVEPSWALARAHSFTSSPGYSSLTQWRWELPREHFLQCFLSPFWIKSLGATERSLAFFADCLSSMIVMECNETSVASSTLQSLLSPLATSFNQLSDDNLVEMIQNFICKNSDAGTQNRPPECVQESMCTIIAFLLTSKDNGCSIFTRGDLIFSTLQDAYDEWKTFPTVQKSRIIELMLLLAFHRNKLFQLGERIIEDLKNQLQLGSEIELSALENAKHFTDCVLVVKSALSKKSLSLPSSNPVLSKSIPSCLPEKCTFAIVSDFHDQHWYNCYTCGLTSDKGCCSLCAVVCHQGHDVEYARNSSFFCDCGGEESPGSLIKCRCLAAHSRDKFFKNQSIADNGGAQLGGKRVTANSLLLSSELCAKIVKSSFAQEGQQAISELLGKGQKAAWTRFMLKCANQQFDGWKSDFNRMHGVFMAKNYISDSYGALSNLLCKRNKSATVRKLNAAKFIALGVSTTGMIQTRMSGDSATNRAARSRLSDIGIVRSVLDSDSRGRLVFAEPHGLVFCSPLSIARSLSNSSATPATSFSRSAMRSMCTVEVGVKAVGVKFAHDNENMVLVWGIDKSKIVLMNENFTSAIAITSLDCGTQKAEVDNIIVNAHWLHGSGTGVILGFRHTLLLFDLSTVDDEPVCQVTLTISTEACISVMRDFAIVPYTKSDGNWKGDVSCWFVYVLMDNGAVYSTKVRRKSCGDYDAGAVDPLNQLHFQAKDDEHGTHNPPQKGFSLTYLDQSNLLLYQATNSAVVAIQLNEWNDSKSRFDLLPYDLTTEPKTEGGDTLTVRGPYTHWKQLGSVCHGSTNAFRLSCCAQPSGEGEPLLLCLEFDEKETRVQEFNRTAAGWFDPPQSCEGVAAFSAPFYCNQTEPSSMSLDNEFVERLFLCTLSLNGCLHIYAETVVSRARAALEQARDFVTADRQTHISNTAFLQNPLFHVLEFEKLKNLTESKNLVFHADSLGSAETIKDKLLIANGESFLVSSCCDGFTLTISYRGNKSLLSSLTKTPQEDMTISAVRISVGAYSMENIPKSIRIMGRVVPLKPGQKRWYSIHLSQEEMVLSVRNGFVTIDIDQCFDSSSKPVLDAMEVYGLARKETEQWFPVDLRQCAASVPFAGSVAERSIVSINLKQHEFQLCLMALTNLHRLLGPFKPKKDEEAFLRQLVQDTALENDSEIKCSVASFVASLKPNDDIRQSFLDMAVLSGCSAFLKESQLQLDACESGNLHPCVLRLWHSVTPSLRTCLQTAASIAKCRPFNYLQVAEERPEEFESIAADACKLAHKYLINSLGNATLVSDLVELSLLEIAITNGRGLGRFGSFGGLQNLLSSPSKIVVEQACSAIAIFCRGSDIFHTLTKAVQYVCDSCFVVISDTRYTSVDDAQSFDLCPDCYRLGTEFIAVKNPAGSTNVIIKEKPVGEDQKLTCSAVKSMQAVAIQTEAAESCRDAQSSSGRVVRAVPANAPLSAQQQLFNDFMDIMISGISELMGDQLKRPDYVPQSMVWLSVEFVRHSFQSGRKLNKAKKLPEALAAGLSCRLKNPMNRVGTDSQLVLFIEGLISLLLPNQSARDYLVGARPYVTLDDQPPPSTSDGICHNHGAPLKVLKFTGGVDAKRSFLGCPLEKKVRCNFFAWADEPALLNEHNQLSGSVFLEDCARLVWQLLTEPQGDEKPLNLLLASFIQGFSSEALNGSRNSIGDLGSSKNDVYSFDQDFADGVFCSHLRLKNDSAEQRMAFLNQQYREWGISRTKQSSSFLVVKKTLYLLALTGIPEQRSHCEWFPILCRIMQQTNSWSRELPILAKASLRRLSGALWRQVRDFYSFTFMFEKLIENSTNIFRYFVLLNEKARQCSPSWKSSTLQRFSSLKISDFAGTEFLMSEDASTLHLNDSLSKVLADLLASANKRSSSWKRFCSLRSLQHSESASVFDFLDPLDLFETSPILVLFSLSCSLSPENQTKVLRLIHLGLVHSNDRKFQKTKAVDKSKSNSSDDEDINAAPEHHDVFGFLGAQGTSAVDIAAASADDLYTFVMCLVYRGNTSEIRSLASKVAIRLCHGLSKQDMGNLVTRFMRSPLYQCGTFGKHSSDFLSFLHLLVKLAGPSAVDVRDFSIEVQSCFKQQILALRHDRLNKDCVHFETRSSGFVQKKKYDLCSCVSCCMQIPRVKEKAMERATSIINAGDGDIQGNSHAASNGVSKLTVKWVPGQVSPFVRCRLHASRESFASNEFCMFYSLKNRCAISEIHVEVENPRRHVKTIKFYFSPKPVEDPGILKSEAFVDKWQPCGALNLSRGSSCTTLTISTPVIAANLKIEYADFYDAGTSRSSDGTLVVVCPRCTRTVTNAHGVCSNCGEVAFQCRKCRHINYDRLDAFLCVECGYCAAASFQFELNAGVASNSVAITNDAEYGTMVKMSALASHLHRDLRAALKVKLAALMCSKKKGVPAGGAESDIVLGIDAVRRAFDASGPAELVIDSDESMDFSKLTMNQLGKNGSIVKIVARPDSRGESSLYRLARQAQRSTAGGRSENVMIQGFRVEDETASELLGGLLDGPGGLSRLAGLDAGDPLSQLLASVQSRREQREAEEQVQALNGDTGTCGNKKSMHSNAKKAVEECDRLFELMREAEREAYLLECRCIAWRRLNSGRLRDLDIEQQQLFNFEPSHCSSCAAAIAVQLLVLWLRFFQLNPDVVMIDQEMISLLLHDVTTSHLRNLQETRKAIVKEIAICSKQGRPLVVDALRARLNLTQDVNSAEILDKILQSLCGDPEAAAPFLALVREALEHNTNI